MKKPITDRAEVGFDFPDKAFYGSFGRAGRYEATADGDGVHIRLSRTAGERRDVGFHLHYYLLADILSDLAEGLEAMPALDDAHRLPMQEAATALRHAMRKRR